MEIKLPIHSKQACLDIYYPRRTPSAAGIDQLRKVIQNASSVANATGATTGGLGFLAGLAGGIGGAVLGLAKDISNFVQKNFNKSGGLDSKKEKERIHDAAKRLESQNPENYKQWHTFPVAQVLSYMEKMVERTGRYATSGQTPQIRESAYLIWIVEQGAKLVEIKSQTSNQVNQNDKGFTSMPITPSVATTKANQNFTIAAAVGALLLLKGL